MDTIGGLIDKLVTVKLKIQHASVFDSMPDLSMQKDRLIEEIDAKLIEMLAASRAGEQLDNGAFIQRNHKTY